MLFAGFKAKHQSIFEWKLLVLLWVLYLSSNYHQDCAFKCCEIPWILSNPLVGKFLPGFSIRGYGLENISNTRMAYILNYWFWEGSMVGRGKFCWMVAQNNRHQTLIIRNMTRFLVSDYHCALLIMQCWALYCVIIPPTPLEEQHMKKYRLIYHSNLTECCWDFTGNLVVFPKES